MNNEEAISTLAYELREGRATNELVFETLDGFNPVLNSSLAQKNVEESNAFYGFMFDIVLAIKDTLVNLKDELLGNKLQEEENRREMITTLSRIGEGNGSTRVPPPLPGEARVEDEPAGPIAQGIFAGIAAAITPFIPAFLKKMFVPLSTTFAAVAKFGKQIGTFAKQLVKFAGPIGIAVSIITAIIGAIQGGIKGYEEDGIAGAIKGAVVGAVDLLIGTLVKGVADAIGWILDKIGMKESGGMFGEIIKKIFDGLYSWFGGLIDFFHGIFTLDAKKTIGGVKQMLSSLFGIFENIGTLLITLVKEAVPLIGSILKGLLWNLPMFLGEMMGYLTEWMKNELPGLIATAVAKITVFTQELFAEFEKQILPWLASMGEKAIGLLSFLGTKISDFIGSVIDSIMSVFNDPAVRDSLYKDILRSIIPARTGETSWNDPKHWVAKAIPDSVYQFAGMPTKEGTGLNDATGGVNPFDKQAKAMAAGHASWEAYEKSGWQFKGPSIKGLPSNAGQTLSDSTKAPMSAPVIINQMGGNVTNMSTSNVSNNTTNMDPIFTGSALGLSNQ